VSGSASGPRANFGQRLVAAIIDGIIVGIVGGIIQVTANSTIGGLVSLAIGIAYYGWLEGSPSGQTVGKRVMNIRVYDLRQGGPIGTGRAIGRYFARILSTIPCLLGYFWMLWDKEKQTWHDKLVGSVVVPTSAYPVDNWPG
jgi:serine/threonine-protein kinase